VTGFINDASRVRLDGLNGFARLHGELVILDDGARHVRRRSVKLDRVALVSGGGSGHEPMHVGFVGAGMLDAACPGEVFTAPTPDQIASAIAAVDAGRGVLLIVKNYSGDLMNFGMAVDMVSTPTATVSVEDDVSVPRVFGGVGRRGVAGTLVVEKLLGAAAEAGADLQTLAALGERVNARLRSMGVALRPCVVPQTNLPNFALSPSEMELGVGIHGEAGRHRVPRMSADAIASELVTAVLSELAPEAGDDALVLLNGFGATPPAELYIMANSIGGALERAGVRPWRWVAGSFATSLDMAGCSLTIALLDRQLKGFWDAPVHTAAWRW